MVQPKLETLTIMPPLFSSKILGSAIISTVKILDNYNTERVYTRDKIEKSWGFKVARIGYVERQ